MTSEGAAGGTGDIGRRVSAVEGEVAEPRDQVAEAKADARAARVLGAGADRDVSDLRTALGAHHRVLTALRETQLEHGADLRRLQATVAPRDEVAAGFATVHEGMRQIVVVLEGLTPGGPGSPN